MSDTPEKATDLSCSDASILNMPHPSLWRRYDFKICRGSQALASVLAEINKNGWVLVTVTQHRRRTYTVFFKRFISCQKNDDV